MTNIEKVRDFILQQFQKQMDVPYRNIGIEHTMQVVSYAYLLSKKRNLNLEELVIASYFHDISTYISHYSQNHALRSAKFAQENLPKITTLSENSITQIVSAIAHHSTKDITHDTLSEALKDADIMSHYYSGVILSDNEKQRLESIF